MALALSYFASLLLHLFPSGSINDRLVHIAEYRQIFRIVGNPFLVLVGFAVGLEIDNISSILLQAKHFDDG